MRTSTSLSRQYKTLSGGQLNVPVSHLQIDRQLGSFAQFDLVLPQFCAFLTLATEISPRCPVCRPVLVGIQSPPAKHVKSVLDFFLFPRRLFVQILRPLFLPSPSVLRPFKPPSFHPPFPSLASPSVFFSWFSPSLVDSLWTFRNYPSPASRVFSFHIRSSERECPFFCIIRFFY